MVAMMGLLPKLMSNGTGAEIQRPLATVIFGGLISATLLTLLVIPSFYRFINRRVDRNRSEKNRLLNRRKSLLKVGAESRRSEKQSM